MKVLVPSRFEKDGLKIMEDAGLELKLYTGRAEEDILRDSKDSAAIIASRYVTRRVLESSDKLKVVARPGVGLDTFDVDAATEMGIPIIFCGDATTLPVAEHTIALILTLARDIARADQLVRQGKRREYMSGARMLYDVEGKTLGVIGFGRIGRLVASKAKALGMKIIAYDPFISKENIIKMGAEPADIPTIMRNSDYITLHTPLLESTYHLIGKEQLALMKKTAFLVNASRGEVVDEKALIEVLQAKKIAGAGLDVVEDEGPDNPILKLDNVVVTPHRAFFTSEGQYRTAINVANDVVKALRGETPRWLGNPEVLSRPNLRIKSSQK